MENQFLSLCQQEIITLHIPVYEEHQACFLFMLGCCVLENGILQFGALTKTMLRSLPTAPSPVGGWTGKLEVQQPE